MRVFSTGTDVCGFKGIVSDHGSTALAVTYIGYGIKIPTNLGLQELLLQKSSSLLMTTPTRVSPDYAEKCKHVKNQTAEFSTQPHISIFVLCIVSN